VRRDLFHLGEGAEKGAGKKKEERAAWGIWVSEKIDKERGKEERARMRLRFGWIIKERLDV